MCTTLLDHPVIAAHQCSRSYECRINDLAGRPFADEIVAASKVAAVAGMGCDTLLDNAHRDDPLRIDIHPFHHALQQGRLGLQRAASYPHAQHLVTVNRFQMIGRQIDKNIFLMFLRCVIHPPAAALHIDQQEPSVPLPPAAFVQFLLHLCQQFVMWLHRIEESLQTVLSHPV